jgi:hypothetical protein
VSAGSVRGDHVPRPHHAASHGIQNVSSTSRTSPSPPSAGLTALRTRANAQMPPPQIARPSVIALGTYACAPSSSRAASR